MCVCVVCVFAGAREREREFVLIFFFFGYGEDSERGGGVSWKTTTIYSPCMQMSDVEIKGETREKRECLCVLFVSIRQSVQRRKL